MKVLQRRMTRTMRLMPMKRKNLHPLNLNPSKNKMYESGSGSLCGREKDFSRHIDEKTNPMADVFLSWFFLFSVFDDSGD